MVVWEIELGVNQNQKDNPNNLYLEEGITVIHLSRFRKENA